MAAVTMTALPTPPGRAAEYDTSLVWQTRKDGLLCPNYFQLKDAQAAADAGDAAWFRRTGCFLAQGGEKVIVIDRPQMGSAMAVWRGRVYRDQQSEGLTVYFSENDALIMAGFYDRNAAQIDFATRKEAEQWVAHWTLQRHALQKKIDRETEERIGREAYHSTLLKDIADEDRNVPRGVKMLPTGRAQPILGPAPLWRIFSICRSGPVSEPVAGVSCWMMF
jgi:hypothetical protein